MNNTKKARKLAMRAAQALPITVQMKPKKSGKRKMLTFGAIAAVAAAASPKFGRWANNAISQRNQAKAFRMAAKVTDKAQTKVEKIPEVIDLTDKPQVKQAVNKAGSALGELSTSLMQEARQREFASSSGAARQPVRA